MEYVKNTNIDIMVLSITEEQTRKWNRQQCEEYLLQTQNILFHE